MGKEVKHKFFDQEKYQKLQDGYSSICHEGLQHQNLDRELKEIGFEGIKFFYDNLQEAWNDPKKFITKFIEDKIEKESGGLKYVGDLIRKEFDVQSFPEVIEKFKRECLRGLGSFDLHNRLAFYHDFKIKYLEYDPQKNKLITPDSSLELLKEECWYEITSSQLENYNKIKDAIDVLSKCFNNQSYYNRPASFIKGLIRTNEDSFAAEEDKPSIYLNDYHEVYLKMCSR